ncbi:MAG: hypothetical protein KGV56_02435 [Gammaproteobacteria bacterium]|nr:hypothetical protein [Gammaproteobacteria bacterium]
MKKHNLLACVKPIAHHIESLSLPHVDIVKTIPEFDLILDRKIRVTDNCVYVYPNGSQTLSQRSDQESRQRIAVGVAMAGRMHTSESLSFYDRVGETITELKRQLINFEPKNEHYDTVFYNQQLDPNDKHVFGDGFYFYIIRLTYDTILKY